MNEGTEGNGSGSSGECTAPWHYVADQAEGGGSYCSGTRVATRMLKKKSCPEHRPVGEYLARSVHCGVSFLL